MGFFRDIYFECKWMLEEIVIIIKHPTRKASYFDLKHHWSSLWGHIIFHPWYCLKRGIRNIYIWFPTIWRNDCWDHFYLLNMMEIQLKEMEDFWATKAPEERDSEPNEKGWRCQHRNIYKRIKWTRKYMNMWRDEHYSMEAYYAHKKACPNEPEMFEHQKVNYDSFGIPISYECKPMSEEGREDFSTRSAKAHKMDEKVFKLWLKNLSKIKNWWD
jgi:hypothetical protein